MAQETCDLQIRVNGQHTFFLNQRLISTFSGRVREALRQECPGGQPECRELNLDGFPGGADGFDLVARFCYSNGKICISPSNVSLLHCSAAFLDMSEGISCCNLKQRTETFLQGLFYWTWNDILTALRKSDPFVAQADASGLLQKLIDSLIDKICANSDLVSSSSSSPDTPNLGFRRSFDFANRSSLGRAWWFDDLADLSPYTIERITKSMLTFGIDKVVVTKFMIHYLRKAMHRKGGLSYAGIAEAAVSGVSQMDRCGLSCRWLFRVLRVVSGFRISEESRSKIEGVIGGLLDQASLDDLLVSINRGGGGGGSGGGGGGSIYDVSLVLRLVKVFVDDEKMKRVGKLMDKYLMEIAPDARLKVAKFLAAAECLPGSARDCFDGVYRAIDMYLEAHPGLPAKEQERLCRALNFGKLSLGACKDLAKNSRFPPKIAVGALSRQSSKAIEDRGYQADRGFPRSYDGELSERSIGLRENTMRTSTEDEEFNDRMKNMQWRVVELEKACKEMQTQMSKLMKTKIGSPLHNQFLPKLCS